jgi:hypothetical protein
MNRIANSVILLVVLFMAIGYAQSRPTRFTKQHNSYFVKEHLDQSVHMILQALQNQNPAYVSSAVQTIREIEQVFPDEPFTSFVSPLSNILKNEKSETSTRVLSAIALDELHSNTGDKVIYTVAKNTSDPTVKNICTALAIESFKANEKKEMAHTKTSK